MCSIVVKNTSEYTGVRISQVVGGEYTYIGDVYVGKTICLIYTYRYVYMRHVFPTYTPLYSPPTT
jgi:hypothetical protein